jgi:2-methylcitrate dehydratase PrpD
VGCETATELALLQTKEQEGERKVVELDVLAAAVVVGVIVGLHRTHMRQALLTRG